MGRGLPGFKEARNHLQVPLAVWKPVRGRHGAWRGPDTGWKVAQAFEGQAPKFGQMFISTAGVSPEGSKRQHGVGDKARVWKQKTWTASAARQGWRRREGEKGQLPLCTGLLSLENGDNTSH